MKLSLLLAGIVAASLASGGHARSARKQEPTPAVIAAIVTCRALADTPARLACYDAAAAGLAQAIDRKAIYVVDKAQVQKTRRSLFGLPLPSLGIMGDDSDDENKVVQLDGVIRGASAGFDGNWMITLEDGSVWRQVDASPLGHSPRKGDKIVVKRAALGSYKMNVAGQSAVRVRRVG